MSGRLEIDALQFPELGWERPRAERAELAHGVRVHLLEDRRLPLVDLVVTVRTGALYEPSERAGISEMVAHLMRTGGTARRDWRAVDDRVDDLALQLSIAIGSESGRVSIGVHRDRLVPALEFLFELMAEPRFAPDRIDVARNKLKEKIRRQNDNPIQIALREFHKVLYGADHPRAFVPSHASVDAIGRDDLIAFHQRYFQPGGFSIGIAGDFDREAVLATLDRHLTAWPARPVDLPEPPGVPPSEATRLFVADKASATQSTVLVGKLAVRATDPERWPLEVGNYILGSGGFTSRITDAVRNRGGLAYVAASSLSFGHVDPGVFSAYALTKMESTARALELILREIERIQSEPVTADELTRARSSLLNAEVFEYARTSDVVSTSLSLDYHGLPEDLPERRIEAIRRMTDAEVLDAARRVLDRPRLQLLVVGNAAGFRDALAAHGEIHTIDLDEPEG